MKNKKLYLRLIETPAVRLVYFVTLLFVVWILHMAASLFVTIFTIIFLFVIILIIKLGYYEYKNKFAKYIIIEDDGAFIRFSQSKVQKVLFKQIKSVEITGTFSPLTHQGYCIIKLDSDSEKYEIYADNTRNVKRLVKVFKEQNIELKYSSNEVDRILNK